MRSLSRLAFLLGMSILMFSLTLGGAKKAHGYPFGMREYPGNPVYDPSDHRAYYPCVLYDAAGFSGHGHASYYKMWYGGYSSKPGATSNMAVTYSEDGINWSEPEELTGILSTGYHAQVVYVPEGYGSGPYYYKIWYWDGIDDNIYSFTAIRTADSVDGVNWENDHSITQDPAAPLVTGIWPDWNRGTYGPVCVLYNPGASNTGGNPFDYTFAMYYDGTTGAKEVIGLGYSADGNYWRRYGDDPVLGLGNPGEWDENYATFGTVARDQDGDWHLWYSGGVSASNEGIGYASSDDGIHWTKDPENPILHITDGVPWRDVRTYTPSVLISPTRFDGHGEAALLKMWFSGRTNTPSTNYAVGYLTTPYPVLELAKGSSPAGEAVRGGVITYTLRLRNVGSSAAEGTVLTDPVPPYTSYVAHTTTLNGVLLPDPPQGSPLASGLQVNSPGEAPGVIAPGEEAVVTFMVQVGSDLPLGASVRNLASAMATNADPVEASCINPSSSQLPSSWYFAEGSTQPGFDQFLLLSNMGDQDLEVAVTYLTDKGEERTFSHRLPAHSRQTVYVNAEMPGESGLGTIINGDGSFICERSMYYRYGEIAGGDIAMGVPSPSLDLFLAEGFTGIPGSEFDEWILVLNPGYSTAEIDVDYLFPGGSSLSKGYKVPARSRTTINVDSEVGEGQEVSARLRSSIPVVVERSMYFRYWNGWKGGHTGMASTGSRTDWFLAEGFTGHDHSRFDTWILVANENEDPTQVTVTYMFPGGGTETLTYTAPARGRLTISADRDLGEGREFSARIHSELPVVVERAMYFDYWNLWDGGHNGSALSSPAAELYFAEGYTGNPASDFQTWLLIQNATGEKKDVRVEYFLGSGEVVRQELSLEPFSRTTVFVDPVLGGGSLEFSTRISTSDGSPSILAERAMYFDYLGSFGRSPGGHVRGGY